MGLCLIASSANSARWNTTNTDVVVAPSAASRPAAAAPSTLAYCRFAFAICLPRFFSGQLTSFASSRVYMRAGCMRLQIAALEYARYPLPRRADLCTGHVCGRGRRRLWHAACRAEQRRSEHLRQQSVAVHSQRMHALVPSRLFACHFTCLVVS